jgi:hypothetical protein
MSQSGTTSANFQCPRCLYSAPRAIEMRFCPRCGLPDGAATDQNDPLELVVAGDKFTIRDRLGFGEICNLYRCTIHDKARTGVFKIARTHLANRHVAHEQETLKRLHEADTQGRFVAFLPSLIASAQYAHGAEPPRLGSILGYQDGIAGPDDLYSLEEVRSAHPNGIDARDMAWMWRRLLSILGFIHQHRLIHGVVTPDHVLIEPREHKLVLIDWCGSVSFGGAPVLRPQRWRDWIRWDVDAPTATDLACASKTMLYLFGSSIEPAIKRHLERAAESSTDAWKLMDDFDRMIKALWGPRQFRTFTMPPRS